jgi:hypothetical protein
LLGHFQNPLAVALRVGTAFAGNCLVGFFFHRVFLKPEAPSGNLII